MTVEEDGMSLQQRLAKLERTQSGDEGARVWGVARIHHLTGQGPDVVTVGPTGETLTKAAFHARYPRGILTLRQEYGDAPSAGAVARAIGAVRAPLDPRSGPDAEDSAGHGAGERRRPAAQRGTVGGRGRGDQPDIAHLLGRK